MKKSRFEKLETPSQNEAPITPSPQAPKKRFPWLAKFHHKIELEGEKPPLELALQEKTPSLKKNAHPSSTINVDNRVISSTPYTAEEIEEQLQKQRIEYRLRKHLQETQEETHSVWWRIAWGIAAGVAISFVLYHTIKWLGGLAGVYLLAFLFVIGLQLWPLFKHLKQQKENKNSNED